MSHNLSAESEKSNTTTLSAGLNFTMRLFLGIVKLIILNPGGGIRGIWIAIPTVPTAENAPGSPVRQRPSPGGDRDDPDN